MGEVLGKTQEPDQSVYEYVCARCGTSEFLTLASHTQVSHCRCGSPLAPISATVDSSYRYEGLCLVEGRAGYAEDADEAPEYSSLDHPHVEPGCQLCAARQQRPNLHRLWCAVFFLRQCNCGYEPA